MYRCSHCCSFDTRQHLQDNHKHNDGSYARKRTNFRALQIRAKDSYSQKRTNFSAELNLDYTLSHLENDRDVTQRVEG